MARSGPAGWRRSAGPAGGRLFILFNYEMFVSAGHQAVRAAWANIWGVRRVCGTLIMYNVLFASYALAPFSVLRKFGFFEKVPPFAFRLARGRFCMLCDKRNRCVCVLHSPSL